MPQALGSFGAELLEGCADRPRVAGIDGSRVRDLVEDDLQPVPASEILVGYSRS